MEAFSEVLAAKHALLILALAYLCGSIPFGLVLALLFAKEDIRKIGSGNIGATNVARVLGKKLGIITLVLDALKGAIPVGVAIYLYRANAHDATLTSSTSVALLLAMVAAAAFLGHCFPVWLKFHGGKGVATGLGVLAVLFPLVAAIGVAVFAVVFAATRMVSASALVAGVTLVGVVLWREPFNVALVPLAVMFLVMVVRHRGNMLRILRKEESKI